MTKKPLITRRGAAEMLGVLGTNVSFLCEGKNTGSAWSLIEVSLPKDAGPPLHEHPWDEAYYIVDGEVRFTIGNETTVVKAGDFIYAPGGTLHAFFGASEQPAKVLVFDAPAAAGEFFRDANREIKNIPGDLPKVPEIGLRHGLRFVRPE